MVSFDKNTKNLNIPSSLGNFQSNGGGGGVTPQEVQEMINSSITSYDVDIQEEFNNTNSGVSQNAEKIETLSGVTQDILNSLDKYATTAVTSAITENVNTLSALTSAITENVNTLSAATSAITEDVNTLSAKTADIKKDIYLNELSQQELSELYNTISGYTDFKDCLKDYNFYYEKQDGNFGNKFYIHLNNIGKKGSQSIYVFEGEYSTLDSGARGTHMFLFELELKNDGTLTFNADRYCETLDVRAKDSDLKLDFDNSYYFNYFGRITDGNAPVSLHLNDSGITVPAVVSKENNEPYIYIDFSVSGKSYEAKWKLAKNETPIYYREKETPGGEQNYIIVNALSAVTNPVEGMVAFTPFHTVDESVEFVKIQIKPGENPEDVLCRIRKVSDDSEINTVYQSGSQFHWGPWNEDGANDDFKFRKVKVGDYDVVFRSYNDSDTPNNSWIEITPNSAIYFDVTNVATTSLTSETLTTTFVDTFYQYKGTKWMQLDLAKSYNFDKMTTADRLELYNEIAGELSSGVTDWGEYAFYINGRDNSMSATPIRVYFDRDYYGELVFGNSLPDVQDNSRIENFRVVLNSDGSFNVETNILKTVKEAKFLGNGGSEIHYKEDTGEFILDGWNNITYTGTSTCSGEIGEMYSDSIINQISSGPLSYSTNKLVIRNGDDYKEVYNCPQPSFSKFSPAVNCTDPDSNSIPFDIDFEYNYGKYSIKFWGSTSDSDQGKRKIANIRLVDNTI